MRIRQITIRDFGAVAFYEATLTPSLNILDSPHIPELSAAIAQLLCSKAQQALLPGWIRPTTRLTAEVLTEDGPYTVAAIPRNGQLALAAVDHTGAEATAAYQYILSHCPEQDAVDTFDGQDKTIPKRLCWYRNWEDAPVDVSGRTESRIELKAFRSHLLGYIKGFRPEPIHCPKAWLVTMNPCGQFEAVFPGVSGKVFLSETEEKLFRYICFLNIAEFWTDLEKLRDLHHEKKPLLIWNFLEYLDASADIRALVERTKKLQRQVIVLTLPLNEGEKKWTKKENEYGIFFQSGN